MDFEKIMEENSELLLERIRNLKQTIPGTDEDKDQLQAYEAIFKNHIAMMKLNEEAMKDDNEESLADKKLEQEQKQFEAKLELEREKMKSEKDISDERLKVEREKLKSERDISDERVNVEREKIALDKVLAECKSDKGQIVLQAVTAFGGILAPIACEVIRQKMHWDVSKMVLSFEEHGAITSSIGKAEFRK